MKLKERPKHLYKPPISVSSPTKAVSMLTSKAKRGEFLTCLYLSENHGLLKSVTLPFSGKSTPGTKRFFKSALDLRAAGVIFLRYSNNINPQPSEADKAILRQLLAFAQEMPLRVKDFIVVTGKGHFSFSNTYLGTRKGYSYSAEHQQLSLFNLTEPSPKAEIKSTHTPQPIKTKSQEGFFEIQNRRFLGNKFRLLPFIEAVVNRKCGDYKSLCDIFSGTGVVGAGFNRKNIKVISNDVLYSNYVSLQTFLVTKDLDPIVLKTKVEHLNNLAADSDNYFSENYGNTFFSLENARKIGKIREEIEHISETQEERNALITSLIYATDKVANTVGHYDAFRKNLDAIRPIRLLTPAIDTAANKNNEVYNEDANTLIKKIAFDVLYMDPPYNSRQYCDAYHLLENLATWSKPEVFGKAKKMDRAHLKSGYCLKAAPILFRELVENANCKHILVSYNNTGDSRDGRSNARISDNEIFRALSSRGTVEIFTQDYKAFTAGKSEIPDNAERIFYCKVNR
ncbi:MAG: DNA adenine methylase [bacterium]